mgnify:CR=1 FL=1
MAPPERTRRAFCLLLMALSYCMPQRTFPSLLCTLLVALLSGGLVSPASAQDTGTIAGVVVDVGTGESLPGANVAIKGTTTGTATDLNGRYRLTGLAPGSYDVVASFVGFAPKTVTGVEVTAGETTKIDFTLQEESAQLEEVIVEAEVAKDSEAGLLIERAKAAALSDAVSAESISEAAASSAADAMEKVTGATVSEGKYVNVRGLGGRYVNTQLNGAELPSADPDRNAVPLDIFPSGLLDNIVTSKTFTPDKPGNFTGGSINLNTRSFPEDLSLSLSASTTYHSEVEYGDIPQAEGGLDEVPTAAQDGVPPLTSTFGDPDAAQQLDAISRSFSAEMVPVSDTAPIDQSYSLSFGNGFEVLGGRPLGVIASGSYSKSVSAEEGGTSAQYVLTGNASESEVLDPDFILETQSGSVEELFGGLVGVSFKPHPNHELSVNTLFNRSDQTGARTQRGPFPRDLGQGEIFVSRALETVERTLISVQGQGQHLLSTAPTVRAEWTSSYTNTQQDEPDVRFFNSDVDSTDGRTTFSISPDIYPEPTRYFRDLSESAWSNDLALTLELGPSNLKVGGRFDYKERDLSERRFLHGSSDITFDDVDGDPQAYFSGNSGIIEGDTQDPTFGTYIVDVSQATNNFTAERTVGAGFAMIDTPLDVIGGPSALRLITGARLEYTDQTVQNRNTEGQIDVVDVLPSLNLVYAVTENMNVRAAYGRTIARPSFREFAPFNFFDFVNNEITNGNPDLKRTTVDNIDLRWEWFMRPGEILAASGFFKSFTDPIERTLEPQAVNREVTFENQEDATVFGAEFEARKRLDIISDALQYLEIGGNLTLTHSSVSIAEDELEQIRDKVPNADDSRALQGQSPFVVNLDLSYDNPESGTTASVFYNYFGDRLNTIERAGTPNQFEQGRHTVDVVASQALFQGVSVKAAVKNLLNEKYRVSQRFNGQEFVNTEYELGRTISVSFKYRL